MKKNPTAPDTAAPRAKPAAKGKTREEQAEGRR